MIVCRIILRTTDAFVETVARGVSAWRLLRAITGPAGFGEPFDWEPDDDQRCTCSVVTGSPGRRCPFEALDVRNG